MKRSFLDVAEWITSLLLTVMVLVLLFVRAVSAGGLWRDECGCLQLARLPTWLEVQQKFQFEAFPLVFPATIRTLTNLFGTDDVVLRTYGFVIGLLLVCALWVNTWILTRRPPLLSLALLGLSPTILTWATTVRGYGPACVLIVLAFGLLFQMRESPDLVYIIAASVAAFASVQFALHNSVLLFVLCLSAITVALLRREFRSAMIVFSVGAVCGLSILPYWEGYCTADWNLLIKLPVTYESLLNKLLNASGSDVPGLRLVWICVFAVAVIGGLVRMSLMLARLKRKPTTTKVMSNSGSEDSSLSQNTILDDHRLLNLLIYTTLILILAPVCYLVFLKTLSYPTQPWYYIILLSLIACGIDVVVASISRSGWLRSLQLLFVIALMIWLPRSVLTRMRVRQTNIDVVAEKLQHEAVEGDLILMTPWYLGVSFNWYYHGDADWATVPILSDLSVHRYDLFQARMVSETPLRDLVERVRTTLESNHRIWLVGEILPVPPEGPHVLPVAPSPHTGWSDEAYRIAWTEQLMAFLSRHGREFQPIEISTDAPVNAVETAEVWQVSGWRY